MIISNGGPVFICFLRSVLLQEDPFNQRRIEKIIARERFLLRIKSSFRFLLLAEAFRTRKRQ